MMLISLGMSMLFLTWLHLNFENYIRTGHMGHWIPTDTPEDTPTYTFWDISDKYATVKFGENQSGGMWIPKLDLDLHFNGQKNFKCQWNNFKCQFNSASVQLSLSHVWLFATPWITAHQASLSITNSQSPLKLTSIESVMPSSHLILCRPLLLLPPNITNSSINIFECWSVPASPLKGML